MKLGSLPWWVNPWPIARNARSQLALNRALVRELDDQVKMKTAAETRCAYLEGELRSAVGAAGGALSSQKPDWILVGIPRPGRGVRVWASRELSGTAFDMTPVDEPPPRWQIKATMAQALTVDEADYGAAMAKITMIWRNWDRAQEEKTVVRPASPRLRELDQGRQITPGRPAIGK